MKISLFFLAITTGLYVGFVLLAGKEYYNYCSAAALIMGAAFCAAVFSDFHPRRQYLGMTAYVVRYQEKIWPVSFTVVVANGLLGMIGLYLIYQRVEFLNTPYLKSTIIIAGGFGIVVAQVGGWILQSFLINLISVFYGSRNTPKIFFNLVGFAYVGFLLVTTVSIVHNFLLLPRHLEPEELNDIIFSSYWYVISGKFGEYIALGIILYGVLVIENVNVLKAVVISVTPSLLLLVFNMLFQGILT